MVFGQLPDFQLFLTTPLVFGIPGPVFEHVSDDSPSKDGHLPLKTWPPIIRAKFRNPKYPIPPLRIHISGSISGALFKIQRFFSTFTHQEIERVGKISFCLILHPFYFLVFGQVLVEVVKSRVNAKVVPLGFGDHFSFLCVMISPLRILFLLILFGPEIGFGG